MSHILPLALFFAVSSVYAGVGEITLTVQADETLVQRAGPHEVREVERSRYFRTYGVPGAFSEAGNAELKTLGISPARGTGPYFSDYDGDPGRLAWDPVIDRQISNYVDLYRRAAALYPGALHAMAGGSYPVATSHVAGEAVPVDATMQVHRQRAVPPSAHAESAGLVSRWLTAIGEGGGSKPRYFSALNEPDASWRGTPRPAEDYAKFARVIANRLAVDHPDVRLSGPCSAWPYPGADWGRWLGGGWERAFIDTVGDVAGAYDFHFYSKELWAYGTESPGFQAARRQPGPSLYAGLFNGHNHIWDFGKVDGLLDLFYAYHQQRWGRPGLPVIVSEFGRQGITPQKGPWPNDYLYYLYGTTVTRLWMRFMDRPEVALTVPFILAESDARYAPQRGQALFTRPQAPSDLALRPTPLREFYGFFREFRGERVNLNWDGLDPSQAVGVFSVAARTRDELWVLLHNAPPAGLRMALRLPGRTATRGRIARMRWEAPVPDDFRASLPGAWRIDQTAGEEVNLSSIELAGEETALLRIPLASSGPGVRLTVDRFYAKETLIAVQPGVEMKADVELPDEAVESVGELIVNLAFSAGPKAPLTFDITVNGHMLPAVTTPAFIAGWREVLHPLRVKLPPGVLVPRGNRISLKTDGLPPAHSYLTSLRLDLTTREVLRP